MHNRQPRLAFLKSAPDGFRLRFVRHPGDLIREALYLLILDVQCHFTPLYHYYTSAP